jgi:hypothetical protein
MAYNCGAYSSYRMVVALVVRSYLFAFSFCHFSSIPNDLNSIHRVFLSRTVGQTMECDAVMRFCGADIVDILRCRDGLLGNGAMPCKKLTHVLYDGITTRRHDKEIARGRMWQREETVGVFQMGRAFLTPTG